MRKGISEFLALVALVVFGMGALVVALYHIGHDTAAGWTLFFLLMFVVGIRYSSGKGAVEQ